MKKKIYLRRIVRAAETFFLAASFSSHLFLSLARLTSSSCRSYDAESRRKFEVAGRGGKGICNFSQTFFIWSVSLIFSFLWYPLDKSSHTCGNGYYRTLRYTHILRPDVYVFLASTLNHAKQKHWTKIRMFSISVVFYLRWCPRN